MLASELKILHNLYHISLYSNSYVKHQLFVFFDLLFQKLFQRQNILFNFKEPANDRKID
jgi:hypothetical protein